MRASQSTSLKVGGSLDGVNVIDKIESLLKNKMLRAESLAVSTAVEKETCYRAGRVAEISTTYDRFSVYYLLPIKDCREKMRSPAEI